MKTFLKIIIPLIIILTVITVFSQNFAAYEPDNFKGKIDTDGTGTSNIKTLGGKVVGVIQVVGTIAAVGVIMVLGIKYMMGSAEEKAGYKKTMLPYFIGAILIFAASTLANIIYTWAKAI